MKINLKEALFSLSILHVMILVLCVISYKWLDSLLSNKEPCKEI